MILETQHENDDAEFLFDFPATIDLAVNSLKLLGTAELASHPSLSQNTRSSAVKGRTFWMESSLAQTSMQP